MTFDWTTFLTLAKKLNEGNSTSVPPEEYRRSAVSRAYYYAYHKSKIHIESQGLDIPKRNPHASLIALLHNNFDTTGIKIASQLARLRDYRNQADYDLDFRYDREWVAEMIEQSEQLVNELKNYNSNLNN